MRSQKEIFPSADHYEGKHKSGESSKVNGRENSITPVKDLSFKQNEVDPELFGESPSSQAPEHPPIDLASDILEEIEKLDRQSFPYNEFINPQYL